jgi:hypothetical protein
MKAIDTLLSNLFDYAGLYPPAGLSMRSAANNYLEYKRGARAWALGRLIVNSNRVDELRSIAGDSFTDLRISVIIADDADPRASIRELGSMNQVEAIEIKCNGAAEVERIAPQIPSRLTAYFEIPMNDEGHGALKPIAAAGARAKIRMGGVVPAVIPSVVDVIRMLKVLADLKLPFKATAGLHHPVRSNRPLTYQPQGPSGMMHGFMNLCCAAAMVYLNGKGNEAAAALEEEDASAWKVTAGAVHWRNLSWTAEQLSTLRREFLISIGSCSFEEPMHDAESLGWL